MFDYLKEILEKSKIIEKNNSEDIQKEIQIATCALFIELAKADDEFSDDERNLIISVMEKTFELGDAEVQELIQEAEESVNRSVSLYEFTTLLDEYLEKAEKFELLKNLWRLIYADSSLDKYEDNLIKKIGDMLKMEHKEVIDTKLMIKNELGLL